MFYERSVQISAEEARLTVRALMMFATAALFMNLLMPGNQPGEEKVICASSQILN